MYDICALTPTGDRSDAFALCQLWMERQILYGLRVLWLVVDDGEATRKQGLPHRLPNGIYVQKVRVDSDGLPPPTLVSNLRIGLEHLLAAEKRQLPVVAIVEDDDWYSPDYLVSVRAASQGRPSADLVGTTHGRYYHVGARRWMERGPSSYSSLCRTAFAGEAIHLLRALLASASTPFIDMNIWAEFPPVLRRVVQLPDRDLCVSIKGMPGRKGIGALHRPAAYVNVDPFGKILEQWIGPEDAAKYAPFFNRGINATKEKRCPTPA